MHTQWTYKMLTTRYKSHVIHNTTHTTLLGASKFLMQSGYFPLFSIVLFCSPWRFTFQIDFFFSFSASVSLSILCFSFIFFNLFPQPFISSVHRIDGNAMMLFQLPPFAAKIYFIYTFIRILILIVYLLMHLLPVCIVEHIHKKYPWNSRVSRILIKFTSTNKQIKAAVRYIYT